MKELLHERWVRGVVARVEGMLGKVEKKRS